MSGGFRDVAYDGPVELLTPEFERSLWFFTDVPAMREVARDGDFGCLHSGATTSTTPPSSRRPRARGWAGWRRASSPEALQRRIAAVEAADRGAGWCGRRAVHEPRLRRSASGGLNQHQWAEAAIQ